MKLNLGTLFLPLILGSCHGEPVQGQESRLQQPPANFTTISIPDFKPAGKRVAFSYLDSLSSGRPVTATGTETRIMLDAPTMLVTSDKNHVPFLIYPGEAVEARYALTDTVQFYITGNETRTNELNFFRELVKETGYVYNVFEVNPFQKKVGTVADLHALEKEIGKLEGKRLKLLETYGAAHPISTSFMEIATKTINSIAIYDALLLYRQNKELLIRQKLFESVVSSQLTAIEGLGFMPFLPWFIPGHELIFLVAGKRNSVISTELDFVTSFNLTATRFKGKMKDFLLSYLLFVAKRNDIVIPKGYLARFNEECRDAGYRNLVARKLNARSISIDTRGINKLLATDGKTSLDMDSVLSAHKGKVVLLDFWASWCAPCREEMPSAELLRKKYGDRELALINISIDDDLDSWLRAGKEESLADGHSFLLLNTKSSPFAKKYGINTIPRYLLIDQAGKIVNRDAPRPSDPELAGLIDKLLGK